MRKEFVKTTENILEANHNTVLLLGDIGVFGFRNAFKKFPDRVYNIGILEQSTVSVAAGLCKTGLIPIVHTIAPFLVERCLEQLKDDFGYQKLGGNFISVGASYDYASLGNTHYCPGDIQVLKSIPGIEIIVPGTSSEFDSLFRETYEDNNLTYIRLSERQNPASHDVGFGKAKVLKKGTKGTVIAVGPMLRIVQEAVKDLDITLLYYTTVLPFDSETLLQTFTLGKIVLCEPYYLGGLASEICETLKSKRISLDCIGVPNQILSCYGKLEDIDTLLGFTPDVIRKRIEGFING
jgi:transketolase